MKKLEGDGPIEKHILLLKLNDALNNAPNFGSTPLLDPITPQRSWISFVGALLSRVSLDRKIKFSTSMSFLASHWGYSTLGIKGQVADAIEELKLELELDGQSDIGNAYAPGDIYKFYADLKAVINSASSEVMVIDPYFDGQAFDAYLGTSSPGITIKILADKYAKDISAYVAKHMQQYKSNIELRSSKQLHDRLVFIDNDFAWIMGGSIKDAGKKATYLIPLSSEIVNAKKQTYSDIWNQAQIV